MTTLSKPKKPVGPKTLTGSSEAKRQAAVILEVLSGIRGPTEGSQVMGVTLTRYYALETRALQGLIAGLEPVPRGRRRRSATDEIARIDRERRRLERELGRTQALLRAAQRAIGVPPRASPEKKTASGKKRRRPSVRAKKAIAVLVAPTAVDSQVGSNGSNVENQVSDRTASPAIASPGRS
jgi:hypothetical protein